MTNLFGPLIYVLLALVLLGMAWSEVAAAKFAGPEVAGAAVGAIVGVVVTVGGLVGSMRAMRSDSGTALNTSVFMSFLLKMVGALVIFLGSRLIVGEEGRLFEYRPGLMVFGAVVFLGFALLPSLLQAARTKPRNDTTKAP